MVRKVRNGWILASDKAEHVKINVFLNIIIFPAKFIARLHFHGDFMKILVVFFSRTGTTKKVAETISNILGSDLEELFDTKKRAGALGWLQSGRDTLTKKLTIIKPPKKDPGSYDVVIIGTPVWNSTLSTPIRTYITQYKQSFKQIAFFITHSYESKNTALEEMEVLCDRKPMAELILKRKQEVKTATYLDKAKQFADVIIKQTNESTYQDD